MLELVPKCMTDRSWRIRRGVSRPRAVFLSRSVTISLVLFFFIPATHIDAAWAATTNSVRTETARTFTNPLNRGPDPWMLWHNDNFYLATTQGDCIRMWRAPSLGALKTT